MSATLNDVPVGRGRVQIPRWGLWWADVDLTAPLDAKRGDVLALKFGGVPLSCAVVSGGTYEDHTSFRLVAGRGKWGQTIPAKSYLDDGGVRIATPLRDAAQACGEQIADLPSTQTDSHYARRTAPASDVLNALARRNWFADFAGVVRIGARAGTKYAGTAPRVKVDPAARAVTFAIDDDLSPFVPGVDVGYGPAVDVEWAVEPTRMTARVVAGPAAATQLSDAVRELLRPELERLRYLAPYEFRVVTQSGQRLNLQPAQASSDLDDLANVRVRPGIAGWKGQVALGSLVIVQFVNGDPSRPVVTSFDDPEAPGWSPISCEFGGPGALPVAYQGSAVVAGPFGGTVTLGSTFAKVRP